MYSYTECATDLPITTTPKSGETYLVRIAQFSDCTQVLEVDCTVEDAGEVERIVCSVAAGELPAGIYAYQLISSDGSTERFEEGGELVMYESIKPTLTPEVTS